MRIAAYQLAQPPETKGFGTNTPYAKLTKIARFVYTVATIVFRPRQYHLGIVPLYSGLI